MAATLLVGTMHSKMGNFDAAADYFERCLELTRRSGSGNFKTNVLWEYSRVRAAQGDLKTAREQIHEALDTARKFSMTFVGPSVLASWAALAEDKQEPIVGRARPLSEQRETGLAHFFPDRLRRYHPSVARLTVRDAPGCLPIQDVHASGIREPLSEVPKQCRAVKQ